MLMDAVEDKQLFVWLKLSLPMWKVGGDKLAISASVCKTLSTLRLHSAILFARTSEPDGERAEWIWWELDRAIDEDTRLAAQIALEKASGRRSAGRSAGTAPGR
jgi:hypothetical protein